jgi:glucokinase
LAKAIGVDLGGTKAIFVLVDEYGRILKKKKYATPKEKKEILRMLVRGIKEIKGKEKVAGIGLGLAGFLDSKRGIMRFSPNIPAINNMNFKTYLKRHFKEKLVFENDANAFVVAEYAVSYKKKYKNIVGITLGTGIGSGVIVDGTLIKGRGYASELGHMIVDFSSGDRCACGNPGCFEELTDGKALFRKAQKLGLNVKDNIELAELARKGNKVAKRAIEEIAEYLALGLVNIINIFDPEAIVIGGGLANIELLIEEAKKKLKKYRIVRKNLNILKAKLGDDAPAVGAALLALEDFIRMKKTPLVTIDIIIEYYKRGKFQGIVLVERKFEPKGWALPGGIVEYNETLEKAAKREALEETGLKIKALKQFRAYSNPKRDPRGHTITMVFTAKASGRLNASSDAANVKVFDIKRLPKRLCFDHAKIVADWLRAKKCVKPI